MRTNSMAPPTTSPLFANKLKNTANSSISAPSIIDSFDDKQPNITSSSSSTTDQNSIVIASKHVAKFGTGISDEQMMALGLGDSVQCIMVSGEQITGEILSIDDQTGVLLLRESQQPGKPMASLHFINSTKLKLLKKLATTSPRRNYSNSMLNLPFTSKQEADERVALAEFRKNKLWIDDEMINEQGRRTFIELKRIFDDVIWDGADILILKCVRVRNPYDESATESLDTKESSLNTLARIRKILQRYRSRSPATTSSAAASISVDDIAVQNIK